MSNDIITLSGMNVTIFNEDEDGNVTFNHKIKTSYGYHKTKRIVFQ